MIINIFIGISFLDQHHMYGKNSVYLYSRHSVKLYIIQIFSTLYDLAFDLELLLKILIILDDQYAGYPWRLL